MAEIVIVGGFPDDIHDFLLHAHWMRAYMAAAHFLERKLGR